MSVKKRHATFSSAVVKYLDGIFAKQSIHFTKNMSEKDFHIDVIIGHQVYSERMAAGKNKHSNKIIRASRMGVRGTRRKW